MSKLIDYWKKHNYRITASEARDHGILDLDAEVQKLRKEGTIIHQQMRHDLRETIYRYWLDETYRQYLIDREANR